MRTETNTPKQRATQHIVLLIPQITPSRFLPSFCIHLLLIIDHAYSVYTVCASDSGDVLWCGGGDWSGVHRYLPGAWEQCHGVQPAGAS